MRLADILSVQRVDPNLPAQSKPETLRALARLFVEADRGLDEELVYKTFADREQLASTGVGSGVAIPHGRLNTMHEVEAAMAISRTGVAFDSVDGEPARIFIAVLAPEHHTGEQLKVLARISRVLRDASVRERLLAAERPDQVLSIMLEEEERQTTRVAAH